MNLPWISSGKGQKKQEDRLIRHSHLYLEGACGFPRRRSATQDLCLYCHDQSEFFQWFLPHLLALDRRKCIRCWLTGQGKNNLSKNVPPQGISLESFWTSRGHFLPVCPHCPAKPDLTLLYTCHVHASLPLSPRKISLVSVQSSQFNQPLGSCPLFSWWSPSLCLSWLIIVAAHFLLENLTWVSEDEFWFCPCPILPVWPSPWPPKNPFLL